MRANRGAQSEESNRNPRKKKPWNYLLVKNMPAKKQKRQRKRDQLRIIPPLEADSTVAPLLFNDIFSPTSLLAQPYFCILKTHRRERTKGGKRENEKWKRPNSRENIFCCFLKFVTENLKIRWAISVLYPSSSDKKRKEERRQRPPGHRDRK